MRNKINTQKEQEALSLFCNEECNEIVKVAIHASKTYDFRTEIVSLIENGLLTFQSAGEDVFYYLSPIGTRTLEILIAE